MGSRDGSIHPNEGPLISRHTIPLRNDYPLRSRYNTSYSLLLAPDGFYGNDAGNGTFNGVVGLVQVKFKFKFLFPVLYSIYAY